MNDQKKIQGDLQKKGALFGTIKSGLPDTFLKQLLSKSYIIVLAGLFVLDLFLITKLKKKFTWRQFALVVGIGTIIGYAYGLFMGHYDDGFPGWLFHPWMITGVAYSWWLIFEDIIFYPICGTLFYMIILAMPNDKKQHNVLFVAIPMCYMLMTAWIYIFFDGWGAKILPIVFGIPAILCYLIAYDKIQPVKFLLCSLIFVPFAIIWDFYGVYAMHIIPGLEWCEQWSYIVFDKSGGYIHSKLLYEDYATHRWAWIFHAPLAVTPLFSVYGTFFIYSLVEAIHKYFPSKAI